MSTKYRIIQVKPEGISYSFIIEKSTQVTKEINPKYRANQSYWEGTFRLNAGGRPRDWFIKVNKTIWEEVSSCNTLDKAEWIVSDLQGKEDFKPVIVKEYS